MEKKRVLAPRPLALHNTKERLSAQSEATSNNDDSADDSDSAFSELDTTKFKHYGLVNSAELSFGGVSLI